MPFKVKYFAFQKKPHFSKLKTMWQVPHLTCLEKLSILCECILQINGTIRFYLKQILLCSLRVLLPFLIIRAITVTLCFSIVLSVEALICFIYFFFLSIPYSHPSLFWSNLIGIAKANPAAKFVKSECLIIFISGSQISVCIRIAQSTS